jgi:hypothetical protein
MSSDVPTPPTPKLIRCLGILGRWRKSAAIAAALRAANPAEARTLAALLVDDAGLPRGQPALIALLSRWNALSDGDRTTLGPLMALRWPQAADELSSSKRGTDRLGFVSFLADNAPILGARWLVAALADRHAPVAEAAERGIDHLVTLAKSGSLGGDDRRRVVEAVDGVIESFDTHRRTGAFRSALKLWPWGLARREVGWMEDQGHPAHMVLRGMIRRSDEPAMRTSAWLWLKHPALAPACVDRLTAPATGAEHGSVLARGHLLANPARAAGFARGRLSAAQVAGMLPRMSEADGLAPAARVGLVRLIEHAPVEPGLKDAAWAARLGDPSTAVRIALVSAARRASEGGGGRGAGGALRTPACLSDLVFDPDERVALHAATALLARARSERVVAGERAKLVEAIARSPHARLRSLARQVRCSEPGLTRGGVNAGGGAGDAGASVVERARAALRSLAMSGVAACCSVGTSADGAAGRVSALAATLVKGLGGDGSPGAAEVLEAALRAGDARVRANAVEAMADRARRAEIACDRARVVEVLLDHTLDAHHRVRANATRGLLQLGLATARPGGASSAGPIVELRGAELVGPARRALAQMLDDARPMHRVAGLWLAERAASALVDDREVVGRVTMIDRAARSQGGGELADRSGELVRAGRAMARLTVETRGRWSSRAARIDEVERAVAGVGVGVGVGVGAGGGGQ